MGIGSVAGIRGLPGHGAYCASKAAVISYCESLRGELRPHGVRVVTVSPGYIDTPLTQQNRYSMPFLMQPADFADRAFRTIQAGVSYRVIPWQMGVVAKLLRLLPNALFDRVLADVPCSASGVARRHPDIKWTRRPTDIPSLGRQQGALADALWALVAPGGKMLYATCSIFPTENRRQIDAFLTRHVNAELERDIQLLPDENHDGFYYALIRKT